MFLFNTQEFSAMYCKQKAFAVPFLVYDSICTVLKKGKERYLYSAFIQRLVSMRSDMDHTVLPADYTMPSFLS